MSKLSRSAKTNLLVANDILNHQITFLVDKGSGLALDLLKSKNYSVKIQRKEDIIEDIRMINPDVIVNDILDTSTYYIKSLKKLKYLNVLKNTSIMFPLID